MNSCTDGMSVCDVVMKLIGPVNAVGDHNADQDRLASLKKLTELVDGLLLEIRYAARTADHHAASMNEIGTCAKKYLEGLKDE